MNNYIILISIIIIISVCESFGQSCLKKFYENNQIHFYISAMFFYGIICYLLIQSYKYKGMGMVNVIWRGISKLLVLSTGIIFFNEKITKMDIMGIIFVILGLFFILYEGSHPITSND